MITFLSVDPAKARPPAHVRPGRPTRSQHRAEFRLKVNDHHEGIIIMTTQKLPGTDAARHGAGDADLTIMLAAHDAFRRDLTRLARAAASADLSDPARRRSVAAGWDLFKRELHIHHTAEDEVIWPVLRPRLVHSEAALSVLDAMEDEHERIDPLLAAVDAAFTQRDGTPSAAADQTGAESGAEAAGTGAEA